MENYSPDLSNPRQVTTSVLKANVSAILLALPVILFFIMPFILLWGFDSLDFSVMDGFHPILRSISVIVLLVGGIVIHELIHGFTWAKFSENGFGDMRYGVVWKLLTPYCHSTKPMKLKGYRIGTFMPGFALGIVPCILGIFTGNGDVMLFGILFTLAAGGDFLMLWLLKNEDRNSWIQDHPSQIGCWVYDGVKTKD